jgi:hypothetical protein
LQPIGHILEIALGIEHNAQLLCLKSYSVR